MKAANRKENHGSSGPIKHSRFSIWALAFGCCIGWGCFVMPGSTFLPAAGPLGTAVAMTIGAAVMILIAGNYHYMINRYPDNGGSFTFTKKLFGYDHGFFCGWFLWIAYVSLIWANATAFILIFRQVLGDFFAVGFHYQIAGYDVYFGEVLVTIGILLLFGFISIYAKRIERIVHTVLAVILLLGVVSCFLLVLAKRGVSGMTPAFSSTTSVGAGVFGIAALAPWAFMGFEAVSHVAGEYSFSHRKIFRIMAVAVIAAGLCYALMTFVAVMDRPAGFDSWTDYIAALGSQNGLAAIPTFFVVDSTLGNAGLMLLCITVLAALSTSLLGFYRVAGRLTCALSEDGILPAWFSRKNLSGNPQSALLFIMAISLVIPFFGRTAIGWLTDVTTVSAAIAYGYTAAATFVTARREKDRRHQITGAMGFLFSVLFAVFLLVPKSASSSGQLTEESYVILAVWSILGFIYLRFVFERDTKNRMNRSTVVWMALLFLIFFFFLMWTQQTTNHNARVALDHISEAYTEEMEAQGVVRQAPRAEQDEAFLAQQMEKIENTLLRNTLIQMLMILIALSLMFSIYSQMRRRESKMEAEMTAAVESDKAKSTFLANMSHDIRTPMNAIVGYTTLAIKEPDMPPRVGDYLTKIESSSQHLLALINDVLEMSRVESGEMDLELVETDLVKSMNEVRDMFQTQMETKRITYTVEAGDVKNRLVLCDKNRLNRVLLNLLSNAYKFTPEGGAVSVRLRQTGATEDTGAYEFRVRDSGIGMSPEFAARVFEAYEREKTVSGIQGTGLGMAITKSIVDLMGGAISVNTEQGKGSEFVINVDFALAGESEETEEAPGEDSDQASAVDFSKKKLLLVEDNEINREIATMILTDMGFALDFAENGQIAVEKVKASKPGDYDAILMDIQMPVMNGYEATREIRRLNDPALANIPIIAMTANAFKEDIQAGREAGMNAHVAKPIDIAKLMETLTEILR